MQVSFCVRLCWSCDVQTAEDTLCCSLRGCLCGYDKMHTAFTTAINFPNCNAEPRWLSLFRQKKTAFKAEGKWIGRRREQRARDNIATFFQGAQAGSEENRPLARKLSESFSIFWHYPPGVKRRNRLRLVSDERFHWWRPTPRGSKTRNRRCQVSTKKLRSRCKAAFSHQKRKFKPLLSIVRIRAPLAINRRLGHNTKFW